MWHRLTPFERRVMSLTSQGYQVANIAAILGMSERAVKNHRCSILQKLQCPNFISAMALMYHMIPKGITNVDVYKDKRRFQGYRTSMRYFRYGAKRTSL